MADTDVRGLSYAASAISMLSIIDLPLIGGGWQIENRIYITYHSTCHKLQAICVTDLESRISYVFF